MRKGKLRRPPRTNGGQPGGTARPGRNKVSRKEPPKTARIHSLYRHSRVPRSHMFALTVERPLRAGESSRLGKAE